MLRYTHNLAAMLILMQSIIYSVMNLYLPSLPKVSEYFVVEKVQVQFTVSLYFLGLFVFTVVSSHIMARLGEIKTLIIGAVIFVLASIFCMFSEGLLWLKICLFLIAVGAGPMAIISRAMLGSIEQQDRRVAMNTVYLVATLISSMVAPLIGGFISEFIRWQFIFVICAIFGLLILYSIIIFKKNSQEYKPIVSNKPGEIAKILSSKIFLLFFGIKWFLYAASQAFYVEIPFILHAHGFSAKDIGIVIVIVGAGTIFGSFLNRMFTKLLEVSRVIATALIISLLGGIVCAYQFVIFDIYLFIFGAWVMMVGVGMSAPNLLIVVLNRFPQELHANISVLYNMITLFMCFVVTGVIGYVANYSQMLYYGLFCIFPVVSVLLFIASKVSGCFKQQKFC